MAATLLSTDGLKFARVDSEVRAARLALGLAVDRACLFPPPPAVLVSAALTQAACRMLVHGERAAAGLAIGAIDEVAVRAWWAESQFGSDWFRAAERLDAASSERNRPAEPRLPMRALTERAVFERDGYQCRYCGIAVLANRVPGALGRLLPDWFPIPPRGFGMDAGTHAVALALRGVVDHVQPKSRGGTHDETNLVTACGVCNYCKGGCTLAALGLADPFDQPPRDLPWDGGRSVLAVL